MATVNKDFKIKHGLIVEGTTGTINGENILTEGAGDAYILDLIGGETLVTSVEGTQLEVVNGKLSVKDNVFDAAGSAEAAEDAAIAAAALDATAKADAAQDAAEDFATAADTTLYGTVTTDIATAKSEAGVIAQGYADTAEADAIAAAALDATSKADAAEDAANLYTDGRETAITTAYQAYADQAETDAVATANSYTDGEITTALATAQGYANTAESNAIAAAETYADTAIAALVDSAPATLDTLNELAAALQDNPDIISDLQDIAAGKQDTLTAGANIDITGATISVTGLDTDDVAEGTNLYFTDARAVTANTGLWDTIGAASDAQSAAETFATNAINALDTDDIEEGASNLYFTNQRALDATNSAYDASGSANTAETNANTYTDNAINALDTDDIEEGATNQYYTTERAQTDAASLLTGATLTNITITGNGAGLTITAENGVADSTTDDLAEGEENLYFTDERAIDAVSNADIYPNAVIIDNVAKQVATSTLRATAGTHVAVAFAKADYRSAEFLVKVAYGDHTEISKVLLTLDVNDNIAITEYGIVGTNGSGMTVSAGISGTDVQLLVTTANNNTTVTAVGTLLI